MAKVASPLTPGRIGGALNLGNLRLELKNSVESVQDNDDEEEDEYSFLKVGGRFAPPPQQRDIIRQVTSPSLPLPLLFQISLK